MKSYSVMPGDVVQIDAYVKYNTPSGTGSDLSAFATSLLSAFNLSAPVPGETGTASSAINSWGALAAGGYANGTTNTDPKLFVTILIFDSDHNFKDVAYQQVSSSGALISASYEVKEPGFAYLYVSNEHPTFADSYFDDVKMTLTPSVVVALNDYYSFGMEFNSYRRENSVENRYLYNGKEIQDELDLGWYDYILRQYDPMIGRFTSIDPAGQFMRRVSPYAYAFNNPIRFTDPDGAVPNDNVEKKVPIGAKVGEGTHVDREITVTFSGKLGKNSTNTIQEVKTTSTGSWGKDNDGNKTWTESVTTETTTTVIDSKGKVISESQSTSATSTTYSIYEAEQATGLMSSEKVDVVGKAITKDPPTVTMAPKFKPSKEFAQVASMASTYSSIVNGSSINYANMNFYSNPPSTDPLERNKPDRGIVLGVLFSAMTDSDKETYYRSCGGRSQSWINPDYYKGLSIINPSPNEK
ncbi:MAG: RHS repeat-associated core domain-containing protein [Bacteroidota bacterium]